MPALDPTLHSPNYQVSSTTRVDAPAEFQSKLRAERRRIEVRNYRIFAATLMAVPTGIRHAGASGRAARL